MLTFQAEIFKTPTNKTRKIGRIAAVSISFKKGVPKYNQDWVLVGHSGLVLDAHAGAECRHISLLDKEMLDALNQELGTHLKPGSFGENITTEGVDVSLLRVGYKIKLKGGRVCLEVIKVNPVCEKVAKFFKLPPEKLATKKRFVAKVLEGIGETLGPGDSIEIL